MMKAHWDDETHCTRERGAISQVDNGRMVVAALISSPQYHRHRFLIAADTSTLLRNPFLHTSQAVAEYFIPSMVQPPNAPIILTVQTGADYLDKIAHCIHCALWTVSKEGRLGDQKRPLSTQCAKSMRKEEQKRI